jgi:hypothetical protein
MTEQEIFRTKAKDGYNAEMPRKVEPFVRLLRPSMPITPSTSRKPS